jgi:hypothetical protein
MDFILPATFSPACEQLMGRARIYEHIFSLPHLPLRAQNMPLDIQLFIVYIQSYFPS